MSGVAFTPEEATDALKNYIGQIVEVDYSEQPFGFAGAANIQRKGKVLGLKIRTDVYEKDQYEWYPPSQVKKTKWLALIEALTATGAMKDVSTAGKDSDERVTTFGNSMLGMVFRFEEQQIESLVQEGGKPKKFNVLLPVEYMGKKPVEEVGQVKQTTIGEAEASQPSVTEASQPATGGIN